MELFPESSASCLGQMTDQSCLYSSAHPGLLAYNTAATNQNIYLAEKMKMQTQGLMMPRFTAMSAYSNGLYQHSIATANSVNFNENSWFPSIAMALDASHLHSYENNSQNVKPAIQGANFRSGYQDARNLKPSSTLAHPFYWRKRGNSVPTEGMTRTRDKYRVVYTEKQRVGLEKEFKTNKFITMQRKMELSKELDLSERQIKIWFQNRRAKERRQRRKTDTPDDHVTREELCQTTDISEYATSENSLSNDELLEVDSLTHNYPTLQPDEEPSIKSQCRFQQNIARICEIGNTSETQVNQSVTLFPTSPSDWGQGSSLMTNCTVSPFTANPDWNLVYRT